MEKKDKREALAKKIQRDRIEINQEIGWLFRPLALCPFPAKCLGKRTILEKDGSKKEEYEIIWKRQATNITVEIMGHPDYGVPFGQDILIILFLAIEARRQGSRKIKVDFYRKFTEMFEMNANDGRKYRLIIDSLNRIRFSKYSWEVKGENRQTALHYMYVEELDLYCNPKDPEQKPLLDQYILLSERFWDEINNHQIPYNLDSIRYLKGKPSHLNFYLWLSTRVGQLFFRMIENKSQTAAVFIPFWGENGIQSQLSSKILKKTEFRREVSKWLKETKNLWPKCPVEIEGDGLKIQLSNITQLDIQPNQRKLIGQSIRLGMGKPTEGKETLCPDCNNLMEYRKGIILETGEKLDDFYRCPNCRINFYRKQYPDLYK